MENEKMITCPACGAKCEAIDNFCHECGKKNKDTCKCWIKNGEPYNCGQDKCPGYRLLILEKD